jgi:hypothetical protein
LAGRPASSIILQYAIALPHLISNGSGYSGRGKFIFCIATSANMFVIMQADAAAGLVDDFGIVKY